MVIAFVHLRHPVYVSENRFFCQRKNLLFLLMVQGGWIPRWQEQTMWMLLLRDESYLGSVLSVCRVTQI